MLRAANLLSPGRDDLAEVLVEEFRMLAQRRVGVHEDDALGLELGVDRVEDDLRLVLCRNARDQALALGLRDAQLLVGVLDVLGQVFPALGLLLGRAHEVFDVVEVDAGQVGAPRRHGLLAEHGEALEATFEHPLRFVLERRDVLDDLVVIPRRAVAPAASESDQPNSYWPSPASSGRSISTSDMCFLLSRRPQPLLQGRHSRTARDEPVCGHYLARASNLNWDRSR